MSDKSRIETDLSAIKESVLTAVSLGLIQKRTENNEYLLTSYQGAGAISEKWNFKIFKYSAKKGGYSIVCNDFETFDRIVTRDWVSFEDDSKKKVLSIDDAGWGFPLLGMMVGVSDGETVQTDVVPVEYFQGTKFEHKLYLSDFAARGFRIVINHFGATPITHRIEICTGFANTALKSRLRQAGFTVKVVEIKGLLQDELEKLFKDYVRQTLQNDIYYDPKDMDKADIPKVYGKVVKYGLKYCPKLLKTGWKSMKG